MKGSRKAWVGASKGDATGLVMDEGKVFCVPLGPGIYCLVSDIGQGLLWQCQQKHRSALEGQKLVPDKCCSESSLVCMENKQVCHVFRVLGELPCTLCCLGTGCLFATHVLVGLCG